MGVGLPAGEKRLCRNTLEKLKHRTNILTQFLFPAAMLSSFFFTPSVTSHVNVSYLDFFFFIQHVVLQFSVTAKRFEHVSAFISATSTVSLWWIFTSLVFIVMLWSHSANRFILTHEAPGQFRDEDLKCSNYKQVWYYSHFFINAQASRLFSHPAQLLSPDARSTCNMSPVRRPEFIFTHTPRSVAVQRVTVFQSCFHFTLKTQT